MRMGNSWARPALLTGAGVLAGLLYHRLVGCQGSCVIGASPWLSAAWLGAAGWLLAGATARKEG